MQRFKNFIRNLHFPKVDNKTVFSSLVALILFIGLGVSVYLVQQNQEVRKKAAGENLVTASFETVKTNIAPNETFDVKVKFTPDPTLKVTAASIIIKYDDTANPTNLLTLTNAQAGQFFLKDHNQTGRPTEMLNIIDTTTAGTARISIGAPCAVCGPAPEFSCNPGMGCCTCYPQSSEDYYAVLTFKANALGNATISLDGGSQAAAWGKDLNNVLSVSDPLAINIANAASCSGSCENRGRLYCDSGTNLTDFTCFTVEGNRTCYKDYTTDISCPNGDPCYCIKAWGCTDINKPTECNSCCTSKSLCGNGVLDTGEVCDMAKNCVTGRTNDGTDGQGCATACLGGSNGYQGYPNNGRYLSCKNDCSGYEDAKSCWYKCTSDPNTSKTKWGDKALNIGLTCPSGGIINSECVCVTPTSTPAPTNTPIPTPTLTPTPIPTEPPVPTPTSIPNMSNLLLQLKLEGINKQSTNKNFLVTLLETQTQNKIQETIRFVSDNAGVYSGGIYNIPGGTYKIYAKGPYHLQKLLGEVTFDPASGSQTLTKDYTSTPLIPGDTTGDNQISMQDILAVVDVWMIDKTPVNTTNFNYDTWEDGNITMQDILVIVDNWKEDSYWGDRLP